MGVEGNANIMKTITYIFQRNIKQKAIYALKTN